MRTHTEKLTALSNLLRETKASDEDKLNRLAGQLSQVTEDAERDRLRAIVKVSELKDDNTALRDEANKAAFHQQLAEDRLAEEKGNVVALASERDRWESSYNGLKITANDVIGERDSLRKWKQKSQWIVNGFRWLVGGVVAYFMLKIVLSTQGIRIF